MPACSDQFAQTSPVFQQRQHLAGGGGGQRRRARHAATAASSDEEEQGSEGDEGSDAEDAPAPAYRRETFHVGRFCCARLALYHAMFHWRRRLLARLKRELRAELRRRVVSLRVGVTGDGQAVGGQRASTASRTAVAEAVLCKESLLAELYANWRRLLGLAGGCAGLGTRACSEPKCIPAAAASCRDPGRRRFASCRL